ncbi:GNAT family N-acetyltransferase [Thalassotalea sp. G20_0]|uniref:GNAT family N-acetyltransferase n=1 Tax=Thalassotalea sp. G20_0 TaxID=2821093 RepID=UPI001ADBDD7C|nr:GNAT family N-acetyltransferase [Thalassotalea sp. G20_0]MBO9497249.1 GNAT family N-acetyltransferase [Thalassotalea sp. G20_0]
MKIELIVADYSNKKHADDLVSLLNDYAIDPMSGNEPLDQYVKENLAKELGKVTSAFSILCYVDGKPAGFANCFEGFSTFKCKPLINIHDIAVKNEYRGKKLSQIILDKIEEIAFQKGCCKITLEVLEGNKLAQQAYLKYGFEPYKLNSDNGCAQFWQTIKRTPTF